MVEALWQIANDASCKTIISLVFFFSTGQAEQSRPNCPRLAVPKIVTAGFPTSRLKEHCWPTFSFYALCCDEILAEILLKHLDVGGIWRRSVVS
jgi:hypothetical protein